MAARLQFVKVLLACVLWIAVPTFAEACGMPVSQSAVSHCVQTMPDGMPAHCACGTKAAAVRLHANPPASLFCTCKASSSPGAQSALRSAIGSDRHLVPGPDSGRVLQYPIDLTAAKLPRGLFSKPRSLPLTSSFRV